MDEFNKINLRIRKLVISYFLIFVLGLFLIYIIDPKTIDLSTDSESFYYWGLFLIYLYFFRSRFVSALFLLFELINLIICSLLPVTVVIACLSGQPQENGFNPWILFLIVILLIINIIARLVINFLITINNFRFFSLSKAQNIKAKSLLLVLVFCFLLSLPVVCSILFTLSQPKLTKTIGYGNLVGKQIKETFVYYKNNDKSGMYVSYYESGKTRKLGKYIDGKKQGVFKVFDERGRLEKKINYVNDVVEGKVECFDDSGKLIRYSLYKANNPVYQNYLDDNGKVKTRDYFDMGKPVKTVSFSEDGKEISTELFGPGSFVATDILDP